MKAAKKVEVIEIQEKWQFPIDVSRYNRSPYLTKSEKEEIKFVVNKKGKWNSKTHKILDRLLQPINDALDVIKPSSSTRASLIKVILSEIHQRKTGRCSYPIWSNFQTIRGGKKQCLREIHRV